MSNIELAVTSFQGGHNCSQAIVSAYGEQLGLDRQTALRIAAGFGGGMGRMGGVCGAVTGAYMVLGLKHGSASASDQAAKERTYAQIQEFARRFQVHNHSIICRELLGCDISSAPGMQLARDQKLFATLCPKLVEDAARILSDMLRERDSAAVGR